GGGGGRRGGVRLRLSAQGFRLRLQLLESRIHPQFLPGIANRSERGGGLMVGQTEANQGVAPRAILGRSINRLVEAVRPIGKLAIGLIMRQRTLAFLLVSRLDERLP